jgi:AcrR family transcriptional regulator
LAEPGGRGESGDPSEPDGRIQSGGPSGPGGRGESAARARILREAWAMIEAGRIDALTMAAVAKAAGVSRQTVYVQFGTRAGLLVQMVRERDATNPRIEQPTAALEEPDAVEGFAAFTRVLAALWQDINPIAQAVFAAALTDDGARAAWDDRMAHLHELAHQVVERLDVAGALAPCWEAALASDWLANQLNPLGWVLLAEAGWPQHVYEERMTAVVQAVLVGPRPEPAVSPARTAAG